MRISDCSSDVCASDLFLEPVHLGQDRVDHAFGDLWFAQASTARRHQRIEFVEEDHAWRHLARAREQPRNLLFALAVPFGEEVGRFGGDEIRLRLARDRLGEQRLAGAGRAIEQEALGRADAKPRSEEHTSELQSLMRISYAVFCLKKKKKNSS